MSDHPEQDAEYNNHLRLLASEIISTLYQRREVMQLKLIQAAVNRALEMIVEEKNTMTSDELTPMGMNPDYDDSDAAEINRLTRSRDRARKERDDALRILNGVRETEVIDKLFLELSQFTRAKSAKEVHVENMLRRANEVLLSAFSIADRNGECVGWEGFRKRLREVLDEQHAHFYGKVEV